MIGSVIIATVGLTVSTVGSAGNSIPDGRQVKSRVLASLSKSEDAIENYSCMVHESTDELNSDGSLKKQSSSVKEQFFVHRIQIEHTLERNGRPLSASDAKKEQERVDKQVKKYSDEREASKAQEHGLKQADMFLRALRLTCGHRELRLGRQTLVYRLSGDPDFHPKSLEERFAEVLTGQIAIDEESGTPIGLQFETKRDVKIGGGLLANLHKGFWLHITQQREPDGVWITKDVQGSGDARAALFLHARFRFHEELQKCHLFSVSSHEQIDTPTAPKLPKP